jgi:hypothetical protein
MQNLYSSVAGAFLLSSLQWKSSRISFTSQSPLALSFSDKPSAISFKCTVIFYSSPSFSSSVGNKSQEIIPQGSLGNKSFSVEKTNSCPTTSSNLFLILVALLPHMGMNLWWPSMCK